jgi:tetratricopeptide (TPR) repeat protein
MVAISAAARGAAQAGNWALVDAASKQMLKLDRNNPEGWFLAALADKAAGRLPRAVAGFEQAILLDAGRYDAAIELARLFWSLMRHQDAADLLEKYASQLAKSPLYLSMAAETWTRLGLHTRAWPMFRQACDLQPEVEKFQADLATCSVLCGKIQEAKSIYQGLLERRPHHQRNHYELSRLGRAQDDTHIELMKAVLDRTQLPAEKNIFLYYAIAKELEDLEKWDESFHYYQLGGSAADSVARAAGYEVSSDLALIDRIIKVSTTQWLASGAADVEQQANSPNPIFVVGLPRTGTTLTERILASHSQVESADETFFLRIAIRRNSGVQSREEMNPRMIEAAAGIDARIIANSYLDSVRYRLSGKPLFVDKYPFNFLYLGFIARAFPAARIIHLRRHPMDACFAMYKQPFFSFAFTFEDLGSYYLAYDKLMQHWRKVLGDRLIEINYEDLVAKQEPETRLLLQKLGLDFEPACLNFEKNKAASATASSVQVREKIHSRSVNRWTHYARHLEPLKQQLTLAGIKV